MTEPMTPEKFYNQVADQLEAASNCRGSEVKTERLISALVEQNADLYRLLYAIYEQQRVIAEGLEPEDKPENPDVGLSKEEALERARALGEAERRKANSKRAKAWR